MTVTPDDAAAALLEMMEHFIANAGTGWFRSEAGCLGMVSGVPLATLNGVVVGAEHIDAAVVSRLLDEVAAEGVPYSLQVRPACVPDATELADARSLLRDQYDVPFMVLDDPSQLEAAQRVDSLVIRELSPAEAHLHARVAADGFEAPLELFEQLSTPSMLSKPGIRCYLGEVAGEPVTTGLSFTCSDYVSVFNIATPPSRRGNGYGAAITSRAVSDGLAAGATWAWLQSSPAGFSVYERLGFCTTEMWTCWISEA